MRDYYFDDLKPGDKFVSPEVIITEREVIEFAKTYDPQPFHVDAEAAKASHFGGLVASDFQTVALAWSLAVKTGVFSKCAIAGLGIDNVQWLKSVRPGDALVCWFEILETRRSASRPGQGVAIILYNLTNQHNEVVAKMRTAGLLKCREVRATSASRERDD